MSYDDKTWETGEGNPDALLNDDTMNDLESRIGDGFTDAAADLTSGLAGKQASDSDLTAIAALSTTSYGRSLLGLADAAAGRTALGLGTASTHAHGDYDVAGAAAAAQAASQPVDSDLTAIAALTTTAYGRSLLEAANAAGARTLLGLVIGTDVEAHDADLTTIGGLSPSNDDVIQRKAGAWTNRTMAQTKTDLVLAKGDVGLGNVDNTSDANKPVSTAQATAIGAAAPELAQPGCYAPMMPGLFTAAGGLTTGRCYLVRFVPQKDRTITAIRYRLTVASTNDVNLDVGILDGTLNRLRSSGQATGRLQTLAMKTVSLSSTLALTKGTVYYVAFNPDGAFGATAPSIVMAFSNYISSVGVFQMAGNTAPYMEGGYVANAAAIPTSLANTITELQAIPFIYLVDA